MLAKITGQPKGVAYELLTAPHSLYAQSISSCLPYSIFPSGRGSHNHGSGIAWIENEKIRLKKTGVADCWNSQFREEAGQITSQMVIAHNRFASDGLSIGQDLSHPYVQEKDGHIVAFCHNGSISNFMAEAKARKISDSMLFLDHLTQQLSDYTLPEIRAVLSKCADEWQYSSLNGFLLHQDVVFAWRCFDMNHSDPIDSDRYYSLYYRQLQEEVCISSEPVDESNDWNPIPNRVVYAVRIDNREVTVQSLAF